MGASTAMSRLAQNSGDYVKSGFTLTSINMTSYLDLTSLLKYYASRCTGSCQCLGCKPLGTLLSFASYNLLPVRPWPINIIAKVGSDIAVYCVN